MRRICLGINITCDRLAPGAGAWHRYNHLRIVGIIKNWGEAHFGCSYTVTKSEPNEPSLWKITLQKRGNSLVDTGTFFPSLTRFLYILLCGKSVPVYGRGHFTGLRRQTSWNCLSSQIFLKNSRIPCFSRTFPENSRIPAGRMFQAPSPSLVHSLKAYSLKKKT